MITYLKKISAVASTEQKGLHPFQLCEQNKQTKNKMQKKKLPKNNTAVLFQKETKTYK